MTTETMPLETLPIEVVTPIRPSEAIRLGCLLRPVQAFGSAGYRNSACVQAAAMLGGVRLSEHPETIVETCPVEDCVYHGGGSPLHLNDVHRWTRERIADWLEERGL